MHILPRGFGGLVEGYPGAWFCTVLGSDTATPGFRVLTVHHLTTAILSRWLLCRVSLRLHANPPSMQTRFQSKVSQVTSRFGCRAGVRPVAGVKCGA